MEITTAATKHIFNEDLAIPYLDFLEGNYLDERKLYYAKFGILPCVLTLMNVDYKKYIEYLTDTHKEEIVRIYKREELRPNSNPQITSYICVMTNRIMVKATEVHIQIMYDIDLKDSINEMVSQARKLQAFYFEEKKINLFVDGTDGMRLVELPCQDPKLSIERHYNDDFPNIHRQLISCLHDKDKSGVHLFHGLPGTGKTTYLRHLVNYVKKRFIFLSPRLAGDLDNPSILNILLDYPNSVLVIEDAEELIISREHGGNSGISMLLNLSDGIFSGSLNMQIICTFNTSVRKTDKALLRKGRLLSLFEFKPLETDKANELLESFGSEHRVTRPTTLADLFHHDTNDYDTEYTGPYIGFNHNK
jgi:hypothetical protein